MRAFVLVTVLATVAPVAAAPPPEAGRRRLVDWLQAAKGAPAERLLPGLGARSYELPGLRARLPDWPVVGADLRAAHGHLELADRRLNRRLELRWLAARPGQLEALVRAWVAEADEEGRALGRPSPVMVAGFPGVEVTGRAVAATGGALMPRRDRSRSEHNWFWYDPGEARVHVLHLTLPGGDVVLGERLSAPLRAGLEAAATGTPRALAPGMATWTARVMGLLLDLPAWEESRSPGLAAPRRGDAWYITPSGNVGRRLMVAARGDGDAGIRLEWRPMPREKTAEQVPVPSPADPAGSAHDGWSVCGHPARRTRFDRALGKSIRWTQEVAWYCPETLSEYRLGASADEAYAAGLELMDEVAERVRCHLPAARGWRPEAAPTLTRVAPTP